MPSNIFGNFIDFLEDTFTNELYQSTNAAVKKIVDSLLHSNLDKAYAKYGLKDYTDVIQSKFFLYAFFLTVLDTNILPHLTKSDSYDNRAFQLNVASSSLFSNQLFKKVVSELQTVVIPGDRENINAFFLEDKGAGLPITTIIIEEGVKNISSNAFSGLKNLKEIRLPASLKIFGDIKDCNDNVTLYYKPVLKSEGKVGVGFKIISQRNDKENWFKTHLKKY